MTKTNTMDHISDQASTIKVDTTNTIWSDQPNISNLQQVLHTFSDLSIGDRYATTAQYGLVKIAKSSDIEARRGTGDVVTSQQMLEFNGKPLATKTIYGTTKYATTAEVTKGTSDALSITPLELKKNLDSKIPTRDKAGLMKFSHQSMVQAGTNDDTAMTPKLVKYAIDKLVPTVAIASETNTGTVTLATVSLTQAGTIRNGYAVTPYAFKNTNATESVYGTVKLATAAEANNPQLNSKIAISPSSLHKVTATTGRQGLVQLATDAESRARVVSTKAVTPTGLKYYYDLIDALTKRLASLEKDLSAFRSDVDGEIGKIETIPIGTILGFAGAPSNSKMRLLPCTGGTYLKSQYPRLYAQLGGGFSVSSTHFVVPDYRGYFLRGLDNTGSIDPDGRGRNYKDPQGDTIRNITGHYGSSALRNGWSGGALYQQGGWQYTSYNGNNHKDGSPLMFDASRVVPTSSENRPKNKAVSYYIVAD